MEILTLFTLLTIKHFIVDYPLQTRYQYSNKGIYGHPGGLLHAGFHGIGTWCCFAAFTPIAVWLAFVDAIVHYHIDWAKVNLNNRYGWTPTTHEEFWWLLGLDQLFHYLTYIGLIAWSIGAIF